MGWGVGIQITEQNQREPWSLLTVYTVYHYRLYGLAL